MKEYRGAEQLWKAFGEGRKLATYPSGYCSYYKLRRFDPELDDNVYTRHIAAVKYYYMNPQMNRLFAMTQYGYAVDAEFSMWDLNVTTWYDYDELISDEKNNPVELTVAEIQKKLGYKIKIVE